SGRAGGILCEHAGAADGRLRRSEICGIGGAGEEVRSGGVRKRRAAVRAAGGSFAAGEVTGAASAGAGDAGTAERTGSKTGVAGDRDERAGAGGDGGQVRSDVQPDGGDECGGRRGRTERLCGVQRGAIRAGGGGGDRREAGAAAAPGGGIAASPVA